MQKPSRLALQNADRMLIKLRKLVADNPVELLIHHKLILDKTFEILAIEYEYYHEMRSSVINESNKMMDDDDR